MDKRKQYIDKMAAKLKVWDAEVQKLQAKADAAKTDKKVEYNQQIKELQNKKEEAQQKLEEIKEASGEAWKELKDGVDKSWKILGDSIKNALGKFGE